MSNIDYRKLKKESLGNKKRWIIRQKPTSSRSLSTRKTPKGVTDIHEYKNVLNGFSFQCTESQLKEYINNTSEVLEYFEDDVAEKAVVRDSLQFKRATFAEQKVGYQINRLGANNSSSQAGTGSPILTIRPGEDTGDSPPEEDPEPEKTREEKINELSLQCSYNEEEFPTSILNLVHFKETNNCQSPPPSNSNNNTNSNKDSTNSEIGINSGHEIYTFVVDTGIDPDHPELNVDKTISKNFINNDPNDWADKDGHGTHVSGIIGAYDNEQGIVGIAPGARVVSIRVLDENGVGFFSDVIAGLDYILEWKINNPEKRAVVNMSLGGPPNSSLDFTVRQLSNAGISVVVAAGNEASNVLTTSPAREVYAITVGAYNSNNSLAYFSNYGHRVDILAPGVSIDSTYWNDRFAILSGTSMAAPMVAGTIVLLLNSNENVRDRDVVRNKLVRNARFTKPTNYDNTIGSNQNISLPFIARISGTTNHSVYSGTY